MVTTVQSTATTTTTTTTSPSSQVFFNHSFSIEPFDKNICSWERWVERLEGAFKVFGTVDVMRVHLLLHYVGQSTYNTICDKLAPEKPNEKSYEALVELLQTHFDPKPLEIVENYRFHMRKQREGETAEDFIIALRKLAINCNFGPYLDTALRNQFVFGVRNAKFLNRLLEMDDLKLDKAVKKASSMELSERGGAEIHKNTAEKILHLDASHKSKLSTNKNIQKCYRCGSEAHLANACKHSKTTCLHCSKIGHLRNMCLTLKKEGDSKKSKNEIIVKIIVRQITQKLLLI